MVNKKTIINNVLITLVCLFFVVTNVYGERQVQISRPGTVRKLVESEFLEQNSNKLSYTDSQEELFELLESSHILIKVEQEQLAGLIKNLQTDDIKMLHEIASKVSLKVDKDKKMLNRLVNNVDKLINNRYSRIVARAKKRNIEDAKEALFSFEQAFTDKFILMFDCNRCDKAENYQNIIKNNTLFLIENDEFTSIPALWDEIRLMINTPYKRWNKKYNKLEKKLKRGKKDFQIYYESITFQETNFVKIFYIIKQLLKQITEADAPDIVFHQWDN